MISIKPTHRAQVPYRVQRAVMLTNLRAQHLAPANPRLRDDDELARIQAAIDKRLRKAAR